MSLPGFPDFVKGLPELDVQLDGLEGWLLQGETKQVAFMHFRRDADVPEHSHAAQWEIVVSGEVELTLSGSTRAYREGESFFVPADAPHSARVRAGYRSIVVFDQVDRYRAKGSID